MSHDGSIGAAADLLWDHWQRGACLPALPEAIRPRTRQDGYRVQAALAAHSAAPLFGWKIAATSTAGQRHIGVDGPLAGRLLREKLHRSGAELPIAGNHMRVAEAEFAFRMSRDLPPRGSPYQAAEVLAAVETLHPAIELPSSRYNDFTIVGAPQLIADNGCAHLFVLGAAADQAWRSINLVEHRVSCAVGDKVCAEGTGANVLGDPLVALAWIANEVAELGPGLRAGEIVTTGTCVVPVPIASGDHVVADFGVLGEVSVRLI